MFWFFFFVCLCFALLGFGLVLGFGFFVGFFCGQVGFPHASRVCAVAVRVCSLSLLPADYIKETISTVSEIKLFRELLEVHVNVTVQYNG